MAAADAPVEPALAPPAAQGGAMAEQRAILEAVAAGTLSPAEAASLLDNLERRTAGDVPPSTL